MVGFFVTHWSDGFVFFVIRRSRSSAPADVRLQASRVFRGGSGATPAVGHRPRQNYAGSKAQSTGKDIRHRRRLL